MSKWAWLDIVCVKGNGVEVSDRLEPRAERVGSESVVEGDGHADVVFAFGQHDVRTFFAGIKRCRFPMRV